jgi:hypothetical protein
MVNQKSVFWKAFLFAVFVFIIGLLMGYSFEASNLKKLNNYYTNSEIALMDILAFQNFIDSPNADCNDLVLANLQFADRIYNEAKVLEKYEEAGKMVDGFKILHKKYDLLRTILWINVQKTSDKCPNKLHSVVYLYEYSPKDLTKKATQTVWSRILMDLKDKHGSDIILISIAADGEVLENLDNQIISLDSLISKFEIEQYPVVIVDDKYVISDLKSTEDFEKYLN